MLQPRIRIDDLPGDDGPPILGNTLRYFGDPYQFHSEMRERYGEVYRTRAFLNRYVVVASREAVGYVLADSEANFSSKLGWEKSLGRMFPNSLITMDFAEHRHHRQIIQSAFRPSAMQGYAALLNQVVTASVDGWDASPVLKIYPALQSLALAITMEVLFGLDSQGEIESIRRKYLKVLRGLTAFIRYPWPGTPIRRGLLARDDIHEHFRPLLAQRRNAAGSDLLTRLCLAADEHGNQLSDTAILQHLVQLLSAGYDTTSTALTMALYYLARFPHWQERLRARSQQLGEAPVSYERAAELVEHEWVLNEVLRLYPPGIGVLRKTLRDCHYKHYAIPAHSFVLVDAGTVHRSSEYWTEPLAFDPERFAPGREEHKRHKYQWIPFGGGKHVCIGQHFGTLFAKITLHQLLLRFRFEAVDGERMAFSYIPNVAPKNGLPLRITRLPAPERSVHSGSAAIHL
jgi:cytochrome P450